MTPLTATADKREAKPVIIEVDHRYAGLQKGHAVTDVYDALVEMITNAYDSYGRLQRSRAHMSPPMIVVEYHAQKGEAYIRVRDAAEGMSTREMSLKLSKIGRHTSGRDVRGYMGRGAKDLTHLGCVIFESIKNDMYSRCRMEGKYFYMDESERDATDYIRRNMGFSSGNGTVTTLILARTVARTPFKVLKDKLQWHYALRDILADGSRVQTVLRSPGTSGTTLRYRRPEGEIVVDEQFLVPGYKIPARMTIRQAPEKFDQYAPGDRFNKAGIIIKDKFAVHQAPSFLHSDLDHDPYALYFFGEIYCPHIRDLMQQFDFCLKNDQEFPEDNNQFIIDPQRQSGLRKMHPFTRALLQIPTQRIRALVENIKQAERLITKRVTDTDLQNRLKSLAKIGNRFLGEIGDGPELVEGGLSKIRTELNKRAAYIYPPHAQLQVGEDRTFSLYVKTDIAIQSEHNRKFNLECSEPDAVTLIASPVEVSKHRNKDIFWGTFRVKAKKPVDAAMITAQCPGVTAADCVVEIVEAKDPDWDFEKPFEFEHDSYQVRLDDTRDLVLYGSYPSFIKGPTKVSIRSSNGRAVQVHGRTCLMQPMAGVNYARGRLTVRGRALKGEATIVAECGKRHAEARVRVVEKEKPSESGGLSFDVRDVDFGDYGYQWARNEGRPNMLIVGGRSKSIARYIDDISADKIPTLARQEIANIISYAVGIRMLEQEIRVRPGDFVLDAGDISHVVTSVTDWLIKRRNQFAADAHRLLVTDSEVSLTNELPEKLEEAEERLKAVRAKKARRRK